MSTTAELTEEKVLEALRTVRFPGLSRDIVSFGFVKDLAVGGGNVSFRLEIVTESPRAAEEIKREATEKLRSLPGVTAVTIRLDLQQPGPPPPRGAVGVPPPSASILAEVRYKIAVASGKGGVGKSTVAANLALREEISRRVALPLRVPPPKLCIDNGAMIGAAAFYSLRYRADHVPVLVRSGLTLAS